MLKIFFLSIMYFFRFGIFLDQSVAQEFQSIPITVEFLGVIQCLGDGSNSIDSGSLKFEKKFKKHESSNNLTDYLVEAFNLLPRKLQDRLKLNSPKFGIVDKKSTITEYGAYNSENNEIKFKTLSLQSREVFISTALHEIGHYFDFEFGQQSNHTNWKIASGDSWQTYVSNGIKFTIFNNYKLFVSKYAMESAAEDFAESFAAYILIPDVLKKSSIEKYSFMHHYVFDEFDYSSCSTILD